jgi:DNA-binding GntR family transcriptional regulator
VDEELSRDLVAMERATPDIDLSAYAPCHSDFHTTIVEACGNRSVKELLPIVRMSSQMMVSRTMVEANGPVLADAARSFLIGLLAEGNRDHRAILDAIRAGDAGAAREAAAHHIRKGMRAIRQIRDGRHVVTPVPNPPRRDAS